MPVNMTLASLSARAVLSTGVTAARDLVNPRWTVQRVCGWFILFFSPRSFYSLQSCLLPSPSKSTSQVLWLSTIFGLSIDAPKLNMDMGSPWPSLSALNTPSHSPLMRQPSISETFTPLHLNSSAAVRCSSKPFEYVCVNSWDQVA